MKHSIRYRILRTSLWLFACLLPMASRAALPSIPPAQSNPVTVPEYRVVGVTVTTTNGRVETQDQFGGTLVGHAAMDRLCQVEVDPNARAATVREWQEPRSFEIPGEIVRVWLTPGHVEFVYLPDASDQTDYVAITGDERPVRARREGSLERAHIELSCKDFSVDSDFGAFVGVETGRIVRRTCNNELRIACSALVSVPVRR